MPLFVVPNTWKKDVNSLNAMDIQKRARLSLALDMCFAWLGGAIRERCVFALYFIHSTNS